LSKDPQKKLDIRERADVGVYVKDLSSFVVKNADEMDKLMSVGNKSSTCQIICMADISLVSIRAICCHGDERPLLSVSRKLHHHH
jgi:hypothetical protein